MKERIDQVAEAQKWATTHASEVGRIAIVTPEQQAKLAEKNLGLGHNGDTDIPAELDIPAGE